MSNCADKGVNCAEHCTNELLTKLNKPKSWHNVCVAFLDYEFRK